MNFGANGGGRSEGKQAESRIRESNPPPWLGKPMHYRCANPANVDANIGKIFVIANIILKFADYTY